MGIRFLLLILIFSCSPKVIEKRVIIVEDYCRNVYEDKIRGWRASSASINGIYSSTKKDKAKEWLARVIIAEVEKWPLECNRR